MINFKAKKIKIQVKFKGEGTEPMKSSLPSDT